MATSFNRKNFRGASLEVNKNYAKSIDEKTKYDGGGWPGFLQIKEGTNVFRICPPHDPSDPSIVAKCVCWLPISVEESIFSKSSSNSFSQIRLSL